VAGEIGEGIAAGVGFAEEGAERSWGWGGWWDCGGWRQTLTRPAADLSRGERCGEGGFGSGPGFGGGEGFEGGFAAVVEAPVGGFVAAEAEAVGGRRHVKALGDEGGEGSLLGVVDLLGQGFQLGDLAGDEVGEVVGGFEVGPGVEGAEGVEVGVDLVGVAAEEVEEALAEGGGGVASGFGSVAGGVEVELEGGPGADESVAAGA
jgi:hypothetical protein